MPHDMENLLKHLREWAEAHRGEDLTLSFDVSTVQQIVDTVDDLKQDAQKWRDLIQQLIEDAASK